MPWGWHAYQAIDIPILEALLPIGGQLLATYMVSCIALLIAYSMYYRSFFIGFILLAYFLFAIFFLHYLPLDQVKWTPAYTYTTR